MGRSKGAVLECEPATMIVGGRRDEQARPPASDAAGR
jgi:hypothetical protein